MDVGEEEYESDLEQSKLSLKMRRRREASDDEDEEDDARGRERISNSRVSDYESDGQGAAAEYDDEESELEEELIEEIEVEEEEEYGEHSGVNDVRGLGVHVVGKDLVDGVIERSSIREKKEEDPTDVDGFSVQDNVDQISNNVNGSEGGQVQEENKEKEPFAVPTAGAFYMHDDRFRDSVGVRNRRTLGGRKLWESRDDRKWGHDKFEEMTMKERPYNEGRRDSRGRNRARGRNRGDDREYSHVNRPKAQDIKNPNGAFKSVRGKGPRRYRPVETPANNRRPSKSLEKSSNASTGRVPAATSTSESAQASSIKNTFASSLNSASPPFYPSGSSNQEINSTQKRDAQIGHVNRNPNSQTPNSQTNNMRRKGVSDSLGMDKLYIDDSISSHSGKHPNNLPIPTSGPSFNNPTQPLQARNKGRGQSQNLLGQRVYQPVPPHNQSNWVPSQNQHHTFQRTPVQNQASSAPKGPGPIPSLESRELASPLELNNSKMELVGKGKGGIQSNGMNSFPYAAGGNHGDQNFTGTPTFLPVMQFAGQHPGGIGVPAVGMAFPGYVGQPNGMGNSEMTWLPVLAGAAGSLGATGALGQAYYGAYHAQTSGQMSSLAPASSKDGNINEPGNKVKPSQKSELVNDELGQRQNKARRYTEMKFDQ